MNSRTYDVAVQSDRKHLYAIVTHNGTIHPFRGVSIDGVCYTGISASPPREGSDVLTYTITVRAGSVVVLWPKLVGMGLMIPTNTWMEGYIWAVNMAPTLNYSAFVDYIRSEFPAQAEYMDTVEKELEKLNTPLSPEEITEMRQAIESASEIVKAGKLTLQATTPWNLPK